MINNYITVGTVIEVPELKETAQRILYTNLKIEVQRTYKSNVYESDVLIVTVWRTMAERCVNEAYIGKTALIKGRVQSHKFVKNDEVFYNYEIVCEKLEFLD